jgi:hypothetical protein
MCWKFLNQSKSQDQFSHVDNIFSNYKNEKVKGRIKGTMNTTLNSSKYEVFFILLWIAKSQVMWWKNDAQKIPRNIGTGFDSAIAWGEYHGQRPSSFGAQLSQLEVKHSQHWPAKGKQRRCCVCSLNKSGWLARHECERFRYRKLWSDAIQTRVVWTKYYCI